MVRELLTLRGETDGASTSGDFMLTSDLLYSPAPFIAIPRGLKVKVWFESVSGAPVTVTLLYTKDVTASPPVWEPLESLVLPSAGTITVEKRRPHIVRGVTGLEAVKVSWSQATAGKSYVSIGLEVTDED